MGDGVSLLLERKPWGESLVEATGQALPTASGTTCGEGTAGGQGRLPDTRVGAVQVLAHTSLAGWSDGRIACTAAA